MIKTRNELSPQSPWHSPPPTRLPLQKVNICSIALTRSTNWTNSPPMKHQQPQNSRSVTSEMFNKKESFNCNCLAFTTKSLAAQTLLCFSKMTVSNCINLVVFSSCVDGDLAYLSSKHDLVFILHFELRADGASVLEKRYGLFNTIAFFELISWFKIASKA